MLAACGDAALPEPSGEHQAYVIDQESIVTAGNRLGHAFDLLDLEHMRDVQADISSALSSHRVQDRIDLQIPVDNDYGRRGGFSILDGPNDDGAEPLVVHFEDTFQGFVYASDRPGVQTVRLGLFDRVFELELLDTRVEVTDPQTHVRRIAATLTGGVAMDEVEGELLPAFHDLIVATIARDCAGGPPPSCGCVESPNDLAGGKDYLWFFNTPADPARQDCEVSLEELEQNVWVFNALYADLDIDGVKAMSFELRLSAVPAP